MPPDRALVSEPIDENGFIANARELSENADLRKTLGENGRRYAESTFDIHAISRRFESLFEDLVRRQEVPRHSPEGEDSR